MKWKLLLLSAFILPFAAAAQIQVPLGFSIEQIGDDIGSARHITVRDNGDVYVQLRAMNEEAGGSTVALRDADGDGIYEQVEHFNDEPGTGIQVHDGYLYYSSDVAVFRKAFKGDELVPSGAQEVVVGDLIEQSSHSAKNFVINPMDQLFINIGAPSNSCQESDRTQESPGMFPCPLLENHGGVWMFDAHTLNQGPEDGIHYASGIRNLVAMDWNVSEGELYGVQHGRDQLDTLFPELYNAEDNAELPAEEFLRIPMGFEGAWPYAYFDHRLDRYVLAPEYGGDGVQEPDFSYTRPLMAFPGHWAPNDLLFYTGDSFPEVYSDGAFIAFHGSWNRAPLPQRGYQVVFVPMMDGVPLGETYYEVFADNFAGVSPIPSPGDAEHRPMGLAQGPDGALFIVDSVQGDIWKVTYTGSPDRVNVTQQLQQSPQQQNQQQQQEPTDPFPLDKTGGK